MIKGLSVPRGPGPSRAAWICYWSLNYRGCWHQTCPPIDTRKRLLILIIPITRHDCPVFLFLVATSLCQDWVTCRPANGLRQLALEAPQFVQGALDGLLRGVRPWGARSCSPGYNAQSWSAGHGDCTLHLAILEARGPPCWSRRPLAGLSEVLEVAPEKLHGLGFLFFSPLRLAWSGSSQVSVIHSHVSIHGLVFSAKANRAGQGHGRARPKQCGASARPQLAKCAGRAASGLQVPARSRLIG